MADIQVANTDADLSENTLLTEENAYTITGLHTFSRSTNAPFAVVSGAAVVANLDADKLDGQQGSYYIDPANLSSAVPVNKGGTGATSLTDGGVLLGSGTSAVTAMAVLSDGQMIVGDGSTDPVAESGATLRTSIGVGTGDSPQFTAVNIGHASDTTVARASSGDINVEGNIVYRAGGTDVPVSDGGTGASSFTDGGVLLGSGTSAITATAVLGDGVILIGDASGDPTTLDVGSSSGITILGTIATGVWEGTDVGVAHGGTGVSTLTDGGVLLGSGTGAITAMSVLSDGQMIVGDGSGDPVAESGATLRTSIGVGTGDSPVFTAVTAGQVDITGEGDLRLQDNSGGQYVGFDAPATVSGTYTLTMPAAVGSVDQVLSLANTDGTMQWAAAGTAVNRQNANPLIINGDMAISQRATSATGKTTAGYYTVDRWYFDIASGGLGTWTQTQEALSSGDAFEDGFANTLKMDLTGGAGGAGSAGFAQLKTSLEGFDLQMFKKGTSSAETFTVAFWIKATKTGTNILELVDGTGRHCSTAYSVSDSDTWEYKVVNVPKDTSGIFADDNSAELQVIFWMGAGTDFTSGTLATAWAATTAANRAVGQVNHADSTSNNFEITGVQLEVDTYTSATLPPFQHESFSTNMSRCQRYFFGDIKVAAIGMSTNTGQAAVALAEVVYPTTMRATPTVGGTITAVNGVSTLQTAMGIDEYAACLGANSSTTTNPNRVYWSGDANFAAEL